MNFIRISSMLMMVCFTIFFIQESIAQSACTTPSCDPVPSGTVCVDGSDNVTLSCLSGVTDVVWYNSAATVVGTGCDLIIDNTMVATGAIGETECFYYEAMLPAGCPGEACCPVNITVIACCLDPDPGTNGSLAISAGGDVTEPELFGALGGTPDIGGTWSPTPAGSGTYTYTITDALGCPSATAQVIVTETVTDLSPVITVTPSVITGASNLNFIIKVSELGNNPSSGPINVNIPVDPRFTFSYDNTLTSLGFSTLDNSDWTYVGNNGLFHTFQFITVLGPLSKSTFGFVGNFNPQNSNGSTTFTCTIKPFDGGEEDVTNNSDSESLVFFK